MYKVKIDDDYIYHPWDKKLQIDDPKLETELNKNGSFSFSVYPDNPLYNQLEKLKSRVYIIWFDKNGNEKEIFRGRILSDEVDFDGEKTITCEGDMAFLLDSIQRPYSSTASPAERFGQLIQSHNSQVEAEKQFNIGNVTVTGDSVKVTENGYPDTRTDIENKLVNVYGGYIRTRKQNGQYYIDYLKEYEDIEGQSVRYGENILDITKHIKAEDVKTCIIPLGAANSATGKPRTIESVNNGTDYLYDQAAVDAFGKIFGTVSYSDIENPTTLMQYGMEYLETMKNLTISIELKAIDLKDLGYDAKLIEVGDKIPVFSKPHGINSYMQVSKKSQNLKNLDDCNIVLGATVKTLTENQSIYNSGIQNAIYVADAAQGAVGGVAGNIESIQQGMDSMLSRVYPVGSIYISVNAVNPAELFGGTWVEFGKGKTLVGIDASQAEFNSVEKQGGEKTHTLITQELASHNHGSVTLKGLVQFRDINLSDSNLVLSASGIVSKSYPEWSGTHAAMTLTNKTSYKYNRLDIDATHSHSPAGGGAAHNNLQPYITVYMWKRTA